MAIKVKIDTEKNRIINYTSAVTKEVIIDNIDISETIVICEITGTICRLQDSSQGKARLKELISQSTKGLSEKELSMREAEIAYLSGETMSDKLLDKSQLSEYLEQGYTHLVNISDKPVIHELQSAIDLGIEYDAERGDAVFRSYDEAKAYAESFA